MIKKEITLCGKQVTIAYCFATEIAFLDLAGTEVSNFDSTNPKHLVLLVLSAMQAYYSSVDKEIPLKDRDLMYDAQPAELITAVSSVFELHAQWYSVPKDEEGKRDEGEAPKNA